MINPLELSNEELQALSLLMQPGAMLRGVTCFELYTFRGLQPNACTPLTVIEGLLKHKLIHKITDSLKIKIYSSTKLGENYMQNLSNWSKDHEQG